MRHNAKAPEPPKRGFCKFFASDRGYGFIVPDNGDGDDADLFVHAAAIDGAEPQKGDRVSYRVGKDRAGRRRAIDVKVVE